MTEITNFNYPNKDLRGYSFKGQNLTGANFSNSDISGCDFSEAILREANFKGVEVGIDWSNFTILTILGVISFGFFTYGDSISSNDSSQRYIGYIQFLALLISLSVFFAICSIGAINKHIDFLFYVGTFSITLCLGMTIYIISIIKKKLLFILSYIFPKCRYD